jgi:membrane protein
MSWARSGLGLGVRALRGFLDHDLSTYAAALAYRGLLALFPLVIFVIALISVLQADRLLDWLGDLARSGPPGQVPLQVKEWLIAQLRGRPGGAVLSVGALTAIWATATGIRMLRRALHRAYGVPEMRPVWKRIVFSVLAVPVFALAGVVALGLLVVTSRTLMRGAGLMALDVTIVAVWDWLRVPVALMLLTGMLSAVYRVAAGDHPPLRRLLPGAALAAALWALVSVAFPWALATVLHYGVTYGSFSAAIVVLVYLYLLAAAVLLGAEVNATFESRPTNAARGRA